MVDGFVEMSIEMMMCLFFFFQAEDGIRDGHVTGVQTCALPISAAKEMLGRQVGSITVSQVIVSEMVPHKEEYYAAVKSTREGEIGRASCRERVESSVGVVVFKI